MEPHPTTSTASIAGPDAGEVIAAVALRNTRRLNKSARVQPAEDHSAVVLKSVSAWSHTLILTGELNQRSAHALELELERLCEQGVTDITLDLSQLTDIDPTGVAVIVFRNGLCARQGYGFALIPGSRQVHRMFERAGVVDALPFRDDEVAARRRRVPSVAARFRDGCE
jgi:anti-anti-sigma factor